jgi:hypothetical protein
LVDTGCYRIRFDEDLKRKISLPVELAKVLISPTILDIALKVDTERKTSVLKFSSLK